MKKQLFAGVVAAFAAIGALLLFPSIAGVLAAAYAAWIALYFI